MQRDDAERVGGGEEKRAEEAPGRGAPRAGTPGSDERAEPAEGAPRLPLRERLSRLMAEYGPVALGVYFGLFGVTLAGFALAIHFGVSTPFASGATATGAGGAAASAGTLALAWVATKVTQPLRIAATLALTPLAARLTRRARARPGEAAPRP